MQTAATDGTPGSDGSGRNAFEQSAAPLPGVSWPSSVVKSQQRIASSSAHTFDSRLMLRFASSAARPSTATWSTEPMRGKRCLSGSSKPVGRAGACAICFECRVSLMAGAARRAVALCSVAAAMLLLAAACGGGGGPSTLGGPTTTVSTQAATTTSAPNTAPLAKGQYVTKMKAIGRSLSTSLNSLGAATTAAKAASALAAVQADLRTAAGRIQAITPPAAIKTQHAQLAKAVRDFADELDPVTTKRKGGSMARPSTVPTLKGLQEIQTASTAIANKGYKIGG